MTFLENDEWKVTISRAGAEVRSVVNKKTGREYMWSGDSTYWGRVSPVLFPIIGRLKRDQYTVDGKMHRLSQHGFLRDVYFSVKSHTDTEAVFEFDPDDAFLDVYPFRFEAELFYTLNGNGLEIGWRIWNRDTKTMFFSIGGHPAFRVPLEEGETKEDYTIALKGAHGQAITQYELEGGLVKEKAVLQKVEPVDVRSELFENDAMIFSHIDHASLLSKKSGRGVKVDLTGFPFVGIWSAYKQDEKTMGPFVCIEPWYGIADTVDTTGELSQKKGIQSLEEGGYFEASYVVTFH